ncbi:MAG TPA: hypothetical protein VM819_09475 [Vicinamibacterales bacterium]|nr:hypothetical protein [Vicinamibacterales bacterium]
MFVGLDIRSDSILAVRLNEDGTVAARAVRNGRTGTVAADTAKAVANGTTRRIERAGTVRRMSPRTVPRIVAAALGGDAAAIGAARAAMLQP